MRWCSWTRDESGGPGRLGAVRRRDGEDWLLDVGSWASHRGVEAPADVVDLVEARDVTRDRITELTATAPDDAPGWLRLSSVRLLAPLRAPNALRHFVTYREHAELLAARAGVTLPSGWDARPAYHKGNRRTVLGPGEAVAWPSYTAWLDLECEIAAVVARGGRDLSPADAATAFLGFTVVNDWTARDVEREETLALLGPGKAKDFATSLGPWIVTPDEWDPESDHTVTVEVDGETWATGTTSGRRWTFAQLLEHASRDEDVHPGDVFAAGPFAGGCGADLGRRLGPGATVTLRVAGLGELTNTVTGGPRT